jgi:hypothetical protein
VNKVLISAFLKQKKYLKQKFVNVPSMARILRRYERGTLMEKGCFSCELFKSVGEVIEVITSYGYDGMVGVKYPKKDLSVLSWSH